MFRIKRGDLLSILLVMIIAVLAIKVAVPLPLSEKAREAQKLTSCQSNLKQLVNAFHMYLSDWDDTLPSTVAVTNKTTPTQQEDITFLTGKDPWPYTSDLGVRAKSWAHLFSPYVGSTSAFFCPCDTPRSRVSYWWKYSVELAWRGWYDSNYGMFVSWRREGDYEFISDQILLYEHAGWHTGDAAGIKDGVTINAAYMDGHVTAVKIKNGPLAYPSPTDERTGASSVRLGAPMYYNFDDTTSQRHLGVADYKDPSRYYDSY